MADNFGKGKKETYKTPTKAPIYSTKLNQCVDDNFKVSQLIRTLEYSPERRH